jgi:AcrR family transcriptional regulator
MSSTDRCEGERSRAKRLAIVKSATKGFALKGYAGARTEGVARAAGVNLAVFFYHNKTKAALDDSELHRCAAPHRGPSEGGSRFRGQCCL